MPAKSLRKHLFVPELPVACTGASAWLAGLFRSPVSCAWWLGGQRAQGQAHPAPGFGATVALQTACAGFAVAQRMRFTCAFS
jgi:hypothetical protein